MDKIIEFEAEMVEVVQAPLSGAVLFPFDLKETFGKKSVKVKITYDGLPYRGLLKSMGGGVVYCLIRKDIRKSLGKNPGDTVHVTVLEDNEERVINIPADFQKLLDKNPKQFEFFKNLSFTCRKEYLAWIESAKKEDTRVSRLEKSIALLQHGVKTPR